MKNRTINSSCLKAALPLAGLAFLLCSICVFGQSIEKGKAMYEAKKYMEAESVFKTVPEKAREYAAARYYLGRIAFDQRAYDDAADYFEQATEANPREADYFNKLGAAYAAIAKNANVFTQASMALKLKKAWEKVVELEPENVEARVSLIGYYSQAPGFMGGSTSKAKVLAVEVMKLNVAEGHWQMGSILAREKNIPEAEKEFVKMLRANPDYDKNLAGYYADQKQYDRAFDLFEETLKKSLDDYISLYRFGKAAALSGLKLDRGEECLKKYVKHIPAYNEPALAGAYMRLAQIMEKRGNNAEARKYFEIALKQDDNLKEAKEGLKRTSK